MCFTISNIVFSLIMTAHDLMNTSSTSTMFSKKDEFERKKIKTGDLN